MRAASKASELNCSYSFDTICTHKGNSSTLAFLRPRSKMRILGSGTPRLNRDLGYGCSQKGRHLVSIHVSEYFDLSVLSFPLFDDTPMIATITKEATLDFRGWFVSKSHLLLFADKFPTTVKNQRCALGIAKIRGARKAGKNQTIPYSYNSGNIWLDDVPSCRRLTCSRLHFLRTMGRGSGRLLGWEI